MSDRTDWEALIDGAFGRRPAAPRKETAPAAALQKNAARLTGAAADQAEQIRRLGGEMTQALRRDGLLPPDHKPAPAAPDAAFAGLAEELEQTVIGQPDFVRALVRAFRRPFVLGYAPGGARNSILVWGGEGTGRHFAVGALAGLLAKKGLLPNGEVAVLDLARYPGPGQEKLFLQDLYAALAAPAQVLAFDHYEDCHPGFLNLLAGLVQEGKAALNSRYVVQKGMLVDAGTALVPGAVGELTARDKYLVFFSHAGPEAMAERFGGPFAAALGDVCATAPFTPESLRVLAAGQLNAAVRRAKERLGVTLTVTEAVRDLAAGAADAARGAEPIVAFCDRVYKAVGQYLLDREPAPGLTAALSVQEGVLLAAFGDEEPRPLLPETDESAGAVARVEAELDRIVGLEAVKTYVRGLADHVRVQRRRKAQGLPVGGLTMHMIFTGNPGTGKTTIARLVSQYLKAVGALRGGQLVEVSRADLVGRSVGHTAPLTEQVIRSGPPGRAGGGAGGLQPGDGPVSDRQLRPGQPVRPDHRVPGLHRRRTAENYGIAGRRPRLPAGRGLQGPAAGLLRPPPGRRRGQSGQRPDGPQHPGTGHPEPEPPAGGRPGRPAGSSAARGF